MKIGKQLSNKIARNRDSNHKKYLGKQQIFSVVVRPTDEYAIVEIITRLSSHKSPGYRRIPVVLLTESKFHIAQYLAAVVGSN